MPNDYGGYAKSPILALPDGWRVGWPCQCQFMPIIRWVKQKPK